MDDEPRTAQDAGPPPPAAEPPQSPRRWWRLTRWRAFVLAAILSPIVLLSIYLAIVLNWTYSQGERSGMLQKFSRKGWVCKTWEGELAQFVIPGVAPTIWEFTVRDDSVARRVNAAIGRRVVLHYEEHRGIPTSCFGMTPYFVDSVRVLE